MTATRRIVVALSGASGAIYGIRSLEALRADPSVEIHAIVSKGARATIDCSQEGTGRARARPRASAYQAAHPPKTAPKEELP